MAIYMMWFAVAVSGVGAFGTAISYAVWPTERKLALMRPLSLASIFAAIGSLTGGMATVIEGAAATGAWTPAGWAAFLNGCASTLIPVFVAFGFLAVAWLLVAVGARRQA